MANGDGTPDGPDAPNGLSATNGGSDRVKNIAIQDEMRTSYVTYAMSVIISRALPDVRDGLKPSQRRILVAMNDLNLGPNSGRVKCAKICGDTSGNYHPHGDGSIYPTLVRMAQNWNVRDVLIDKQGNFGSLAGMPPAAMRYTEARLSAVANEMLDDLKRDTVDYVLTYDQRNREPVVLPSRFPNLIVNGSNGIAVGMATSIPPHNLGEVCDATIRLIDDPDCSLDDLVECMPGPDFPTGGIICGRMGVRQAYLTGRSTIILRAKTRFITEKNTDIIEVTEIPYLETRDRIREKIELLIKEDRIKGIARVTDLTDRTLPAWQTCLHIAVKRGEDKEVVLNQLFQFSPLQSTVSIILLALVGNRPKLLSLKEMLAEFLRHRVTVIRRRTEFLLGEARKRKHTVEGLLICQVNLDEVIATIRNSPSRAEAKDRLQQILVPAPLVKRALGDDGFAMYQSEVGDKPNYSLSTNQAEAIVSMQLGSLANLEREKLNDEHAKLLIDIRGYLHLLSDEANIRAVVRDDMIALKAKYSSKRRTEINELELSGVNYEDLIAEEPMVVTLSQRGYIKRMPLNSYQAQNRGGKGVIGAKADDEDAIEHLFVTSTHAWLLFFTDKGKVLWEKVYNLPLQNRTSKGRALVNLLALPDGDRISSCVAVREFDDQHFLMMATKNGVVKKTPLSAYKRPMKGGIIAINLRDNDQLIETLIVGPTDDVLLATQGGMAIRFSQTDARSMGRDTTGVRGIRLKKDDFLIGMVLADPSMSLLTVCENGYGKRTSIGIGGPPIDVSATAEAGADEEALVEEEVVEEETTSDDADADDSDEAVASANQYRRQKRGGKGVKDIKTTKRNGNAVKILAVADQDEVLMVTATGKIQRIRAGDINEIGRNTQGVRVIRLEETDKLVSMARIPADLVAELAPAVDGTPAPTEVTPTEPAPPVEPPEAPAAE
ncbi:DNA gyrase subunit A [Schlesneria paludicola]|uniref:DNA gyrase subunit A n=1 Tax=Schlesneria paludicola TaxID=360056 RepID=UPI00029B0AD2|nr:DNA gyrase subunit A [Schlesneria paludicola]